MKRFMAMLLAGLLALSAVTTVSADLTGYEGQPGNQAAVNNNNNNNNNNNAPPPCQGEGFPGCSGPGGA